MLILQNGMLRDAKISITDPECKGLIERSVEDNDKLLDLVRRFVVGWTNFQTADGTEFEFRTDQDGCLSFGCFASIPSTIQVAIIERLQLISGLTPKEKLGLKY